jgi:hypothetical protein
MKAGQRPRRKIHERTKIRFAGDPRRFDYSLSYESIDLRKFPELYRVGVGEQGVLLVEPYKSELLPLWRFKTPALAMASAEAIFARFKSYRDEADFVGMDMARKFLQMGFTRARRYANHSSGRKYDERDRLLPRIEDAQKAKSAEIFKAYWKMAEADPEYARQKAEWKERLG